MKRLRFSIASLLGLVLLVAVAVAALRASTDAWDSGVLGLTLLALTTAVLLAVHRTGRRRAYWLGFALFGCVYLVASLVPPIESRLPTTKALAYLDSRLPGREGAVMVNVAWVGSPTNSAQSLAFSPQGNTLAATVQGNVRLWDVATGKVLPMPGGTTENFLRIGHSPLVLVVAFAGGCLSRSLCSRGRSQAAIAEAVSASPAAGGV